MRIKIRTSRAGPRYAYAAGQIVDHPDDVEAARWIASGSAEPAPPQPEHATPALPSVFRRRRARATVPSAG